MMNKLYYGC